MLTVAVAAAAAADIAAAAAAAAVAAAAAAANATCPRNPLQHAPRTLTHPRCPERNADLANEATLCVQDAVPRCHLAYVCCGVGRVRGANATGALLHQPPARSARQACIHATHSCNLRVCARVCAFACVCAVCPCVSV